MRQEVGATENLALSKGSAGVRNGKVSDFKRVGQAESEQRLGQHLTTPSNPNQAREDQHDDWHADPFEAPGMHTAHQRPGRSGVTAVFWRTTRQSNARRSLRLRPSR